MPPTHLRRTRVAATTVVLALTGTLAACSSEESSPAPSVSTEAEATAAPTEPEASAEPLAVEEEPEPAPATSNAWGIDPTTVNASAVEAQFGEASQTLAQDVLTTLELGYLQPTQLHVPRPALGDGSVDGVDDAPLREAMLPRLTDAFASRYMDGELPTGERIADLLMVAVDADGRLFDYDGVTYYASGAPVTMSMPFAPLVSLSEDWAVVDATIDMAFPTAQGPTVTVSRLVTLFLVPGDEHWLVDSVAYETRGIEVT